MDWLGPTLLTPWRLLVMLVPAAGCAVVTWHYLAFSGVQVMFVFWSVMHMAGATLMLAEPREFGLRLWFPPLYAEPPSPAHGTVVRFMAVTDLLFGLIRGGFAFYPSSLVLFGMVASTALVQLAMFMVEHTAGATTLKAWSIAAGGALIVSGALCYQALQGEIEWDI
jgi:hypothetical protein